MFRACDESVYFAVSLWGFLCRKLETGCALTLTYVAFLEGKAAQLFVKLDIVMGSHLIFLRS